MRKRGRVYAQVLGQFGIAPAPRQNPQVECKQVNPAANLEVTAGLLVPGRVHHQLEDVLHGDERPLLRVSLFLASVCPPAVRASLASKRVGLYHRDQGAWKASIGVPSSAGEWRPSWLEVASSRCSSRSSSSHSFCL